MTSTMPVSVLGGSGRHACVSPAPASTHVLFVVCRFAWLLKHAATLISTPGGTSGTAANPSAVGTYHQGM